MTNKDVPHASDCAIWVNEPCDCVTGKLPEEVDCIGRSRKATTVQTAVAIQSGGKDAYESYKGETPPTQVLNKRGDR